MVTYLSSPGNQMQAAAVSGMPVLISFGAAAKWLDDYVPSFGRLLVDSGAYSVLNSGKRIDVDQYAEWAESYRPWCDAVAALDDIAGDWEKGLENWRRHPWQFPTYHSSDPPEALEVILSESPAWIGLGMVPPRDKEAWLRKTLERLEGVPVHVHGWALGSYASHPRIDSVDSTNWFADSWKVRNAYPWLTPAECVDIIVKRYQRVPRMKKATATVQKGLFE